MRRASANRTAPRQPEVGDWYSSIRGEQLRQAEYVVRVLAYVLGVAGLSDFVAARFDEAPEHFAECRAERFDVQDDVQVPGGTKLESRLLHRKRRGRAADQHELIGVAGEVLTKDIEPPHHGERPFSSSSAS